VVWLRNEGFGFWRVRGVLSEGGVRRRGCMTKRVLSELWSFFLYYVSLIVIAGKL